MIAKYFAMSLAMENVVSALDELGGVGVQVDHVAGLLGRRRTGVHRHPDVRLSQRGGVVGAVAGHRDEFAALLFALDQREFVLGGGFGQEVVDSCFVGNRLGGQRIISGDHDGADAHLAHLVEAFAHALFDDVLEVDDAEHRSLAVDDVAHDQRGATRGGDAVDDLAEFDGYGAAFVAHPFGHRVGGALA